jgi:hypothetical protein
MSFASVVKAIEVLVHVDENDVLVESEIVNRTKVYNTTTFQRKEVRCFFCSKAAADLVGGAEK